MLVVKVSSKGQIWLPVEVKRFLSINDGDIVHFRVDSGNKVVWLQNDKDKNEFTNFKNPLLSKNQLTIPVKIRELLDIGSEDNILFGYDKLKENVYFKKELETLKCPVCNGVGKLAEHKCIVCREQGFIEKEFIMHEITRFMLNNRKYHVGLNLISREFHNSEEFIKDLMYHKVQLMSKVYPKDILDKFQDYYQVRIIEDFSPRSVSDETKFCNPSDALLDEILSFLTTQEAKDKVYNWFRYERNVFSL